MRAASQALRAFWEQCSTPHGQVAYVHFQGETRSRTLLSEVSPIMSWAQRNLAGLTAMYIPASQNYLADALSHRTLKNNEWSLSQTVFLEICKQWGHPDLNLMASPANNMCKRFLARIKFPEAEGVDALSSK